MGWRDYRAARRCKDVGPRTFAGAKRYAKIVSVYDGDTITVATRLSRKEPHYHYSVRIAGIDTPELRPSRSDPDADLHKEAGIRARNRVRELLPEGSVVLIEFSKEGKYGRLLGEVHTLYRRLFWTPRRALNVGQHLVETGLALPYDGKGKKPFTHEMLRAIVATF